MNERPGAIVRASQFHRNWGLRPWRSRRPCLDSDDQQKCADGDQIAPGRVIAVVCGPARAILTAERTALNFLCHLGGVATATASIVAAVRGEKARIKR
jgi:nicotinate-nucleotide pyrophosphorylase